MKAITTLLAGLLLCATTPVLAQHLTKAEEGRMAIGQCYSTCADRSFRSTGSVLHQLNEAASLILNSPPEVTIETLEALFESEKQLICGLLQEHIRSMDACHAGCVDMETAYGARTSQARNRYRYIFDAETKLLQSYGLWINYSTPVGLAASQRACDQFFGTASQGPSSIGTAVQSLRATKQQAESRHRVSIPSISN